MVQTVSRTRRVLSLKVGSAVLLIVHDGTLCCKTVHADSRIAISYIPGGPALEKAVFGTSDAQINAAQGNIRDDGTPPTRPQNDTQVEEFLRGQYKSTKGNVPKIGEDEGMTGA